MTENQGLREQVQENGCQLRNCDQERKFLQRKVHTVPVQPKGSQLPGDYSDCDCGDDNTDNDGNGIDSSSDDDNVINLAFRMMISILRSFFTYQSKVAGAATSFLETIFGFSLCPIFVDCLFC